MPPLQAALTAWLLSSDLLPDSASTAASSDENLAAHFLVTLFEARLLAADCLLEDSLAAGLAVEQPAGAAVGGRGQELFRRRWCASVLP